jgi:hypothetical protein
MCAFNISTRRLIISPKQCQLDRSGTLFGIELVDSVTGSLT